MNFLRGLWIFPIYMSLQVKLIQYNLPALIWKDSLADHNLRQMSVLQQSPTTRDQGLEKALEP